MGDNLAQIRIVLGEGSDQRLRCFAAGSEMSAAAASFRRN
jgi:hypothetical protein